MSTALPHTQLWPSGQSGRAVKTTLSLFPKTPCETEPRAGDSAPVSTGPGGRPSEVPDAETQTGPQAALLRPTGSGCRQRKPSAELTGIARLAASSPVAPTRRQAESRPEYFDLPVRSMLNRCDSERVPFEWTINPYRGCEFACGYCYARYTHEFLELDGADFERKIFVKRDAGPLLGRDLSAKYGARAARKGQAPPEHIAIGTATDPYQPAEEEFGATRACLEELTRREGLSVSITTKSNQIVRDLDLLRRIAERSTLLINLSVTTMRPRLARQLEPRAPRPDLRMAAVATLVKAGLAAGVLAMPILPGLTDAEEDLDALARAAREAGALWFLGDVLFLMPSALKQFLPFVEERFPKLAPRYRDWYERKGYAPEAYREEMGARLARLRRKYGLGARPREEQERAWRSPQMMLALGEERCERNAAHATTRLVSCTAS
jgi:DNA repair photolyase